MTTVTTERLTLRPFTMADAPTYARIRAEPSVRQWLASGDEAPEAIADRVLRLFINEWATRGYGPWAVIERSSGELIGHHGLRHMPQFDGETEVLYALSERVRGTGVGVEAGRAALRFGFETLGLDRIMAITLHDNLASRGLMERLGLTYRRDDVYKGFDVVYYALDRGDWAPPAG